MHLEEVQRLKKCLSCVVMTVLSAVPQMENTKQRWEEARKLLKPLEQKRCEEAKKAGGKSAQARPDLKASATWKCFRAHLRTVSGFNTAAE